MKRKIIPYNPKLKEIARRLRNNSTLSEILLWKQLKGQQMKGYDFHRQKPLDNYTVDFFCHKLMLAIEIDGISHDHEETYKADRKRQQKLEKIGVHFLRFDDMEVRRDMDNILRTIEIWVENLDQHIPGPSQEGSNGTENVKQ